MKKQFIVLLVLTICLSILSSSAARDVVEIWSYTPVEVDVWEIHMINHSAVDDVNGTKHDIWFEDQLRFSKTVTQFVKVKLVGIQVERGLTYVGVLHNDGEVISQWNIDIGDRNFEEFPRCTANELEKGVCEIVEVIV